MRIFVAGATGVLGRRVVPLLVGAGHTVTGIARTPEKAAALEAAGAAPATVDLFDPDAVRDAVAGHDAVVNIATHIPDLSKAMRPGAWTENDRIRTEGSRNLVDAALAAQATRFVQESLAFFYVDGGSDWVDEDAQLDVPAFAAAFQQAEKQVARFSSSGGAGVVLRFGLFYGSGTSHTRSQLKTARRGLSPFPGPRAAYQSFLHIDDAASAVVAALEVPAGVYNVVEDEPGTRQQLTQAVAAALGRRPGWSLPGLTRIGGAKTAYMARSLRVSNRAFRDVSGWKPAYPNPEAGWQQVVAAERETTVSD